MGASWARFLILVSDPLQALGFVALFLFLQQIEGNLISPPRHGQRHRPAVHLGALRGAAGRGPDGHSGHAAVHPLTSVCYTLLREQVHQALGERAASGS